MVFVPRTEGTEDWTENQSITIRKKIKEAFIDGFQLRVESNSRLH